MENGKENLIPSMGMSDFGPKQYFYNAELLYIIESYQRLTIDVLKAKKVLMRIRFLIYKIILSSQIY